MARGYVWRGISTLVDNKARGLEYCLEQREAGASRIDSARSRIDRRIECQLQAALQVTASGSPRAGWSCSVSPPSSAVSSTPKSIGSRCSIEAIVHSTPGGLSAWLLPSIDQERDSQAGKVSRLSPAEDAIDESEVDASIGAAFRLLGAIDSVIADLLNAVILELRRMRRAVGLGLESNQSRRTHRTSSPAARSRWYTGQQDFCGAPGSPCRHASRGTNAPATIASCDADQRQRAHSTRVIGPPRTVGSTCTRRGRADLLPFPSVR